MSNQKILKGRPTFKSLFLDQNILSKLISNRTDDLAFTKTFKSELVSKRLNQNNVFTPFFSPFTLLEFLGVSGEALAYVNQLHSEIYRHLRSVTDAEDAKKIVYNHYLNKFLNCPVLQKTELLARCTEISKFYSSSDGLLTVSDIIKKIRNVERPSFFAVPLAHDRSFSFQYPRELAKIVGYSFSVDIVRSISDFTNVSVARANHSFVQTMMARKLTNKIGDVNYRPNQELAEFARKSSYRSSGDLVDTDVIHFAVAGICQGTKRRSSTSFSMDNPGILRKRIVLYRNALSLAFGLCRKLESKKELPFTISDCAPGSIGFVSKDGRIELTERVKNISWSDAQ